MRCFLAHTHILCSYHRMNDEYPKMSGFKKIPIGRARMARQVLISKSNETRPRGRPRQRWLDQVKRDLNQVHVMAGNEDADNRDLLRNLAEAAKGLNNGL